MISDMRESALMIAIARLPSARLRTLLRSTRLWRLRRRLEDRASILRRRLAAVQRKLRRLQARIHAVESLPR